MIRRLHAALSAATAAWRDTPAAELYAARLEGRREAALTCEIQLREAVKLAAKPEYLRRAVLVIADCLAANTPDGLLMPSAGRVERMLRLREQQRKKGDS